MRAMFLQEAFVLRTDACPAEGPEERLVERLAATSPLSIADWTPCPSFAEKSTLRYRCFERRECEKLQIALSRCRFQCADPGLRTGGHTVQTVSRALKAGSRSTPSTELLPCVNANQRRARVRG